MKYALLIYEDETFWTSAPREALGEIMRGYGRFGEEAADRLRGGEALQPTATATTVRVRDGERLLTDGPFAETREQLGGFYLIEAPDLDAALAWAHRLPLTGDGTIEVRPVIEETVDAVPAQTAAA